MAEEMPKTIEPECEHCGLCCNTYSFWMSNREFDNDPKEIKRLIKYHGCIPIKNEKGELGIKIPLSCIHLGIVNGKSRCRINDTKPIVCKEYFCGKIIEKALKNGVHV